MEVCKEPSVQDEQKCDGDVYVIGVRLYVIIAAALMAFCAVLLLKIMINLQPSIISRKKKQRKRSNRL